MHETAPPTPGLEAFTLKMAAADLPATAIDTFAAGYRKLASGDKGMITDCEIRPVSPEEIGDYASLEDYGTIGRESFSQTVMVRLNGGLGTSMGLAEPKSLIKVKRGRSFLEMIVDQAQRHNVRLCLMNSFSTHNATRKALERIAPRQYPLLFKQNKFPKVQQADLTPARWPQNPDLEWNPPGHGDIYTALYTSGTLDALLAQGITTAFIANIDNLGAAMDTRLLGYFVAKGFSFMMEVAEKTPSDIKGGHLAHARDGRLVLREAAQCPADELDAFEDIRRYRFFNTNNIWVHLPYLKERFTRERIVDLPLIVNPKSLDPRDDQSPPVYQIETAMGSAISLFEGATAVRVTRDRFLPVKKCNDLLALRSDCFSVSKGSDITVNPRRSLGAIHIHLDTRYYKKIDDFDARFPHGPPSLIDCRSLTVEGDVTFGHNITLSGDVHITTASDTPATLPDGSRITGRISL